jgi:hypothetical protein
VEPLKSLISTLARLRSAAFPFGEAADRGLEGANRRDAWGVTVRSLAVRGKVPEVLPVAVEGVEDDGCPPMAPPVWLEGCASGGTGFQLLASVCEVRRRNEFRAALRASSHCALALREGTEGRRKNQLWVRSQFDSSLLEAHASPTHFARLMPSMGKKDSRPLDALIARLEGKVGPPARTTANVSYREQRRSRQRGWRRGGLGLMQMRGGRLGGWQRE